MPSAAHPRPRGCPAPEECGSTLAAGPPTLPGARRLFSCTDSHLSITQVAKVWPRVAGVNKAQSILHSAPQQRSSSTHHVGPRPRLVHLQMQTSQFDCTIRCSREQAGATHRNQLRALVHQRTHVLRCCKLNRRHAQAPPSCKPSSLTTGGGVSDSWVSDCK